MIVEVEEHDVGVGEQRAGLAAHDRALGGFLAGPLAQGDIEAGAAEGVEVGAPADVPAPFPDE